MGSLLVITQSIRVLLFLSPFSKAMLDGKAKVMQTSRDPVPVIHQRVAIVITRLFLD